MRASTVLVLIAALLAAACTEESNSPRTSAAAAAGQQLTVLEFAQRGETDVRRDEPLEVRFSEPLDPSSVGHGSVKVLRRRGDREQPVTFEIRGDRLLLHPPGPFGFDGASRYWLVIDGFPSLRAPRSASGRPLARRFRAGFGTSGLYRSEATPPTVEEIAVDEEAGGGWSLNLRFSETIEPLSVEPGVTVRVTSLDDGTPVSGRMIGDRRSRLFRFHPQSDLRPSAIRVVTTTGIRDLAGNPLRSVVERILEIPASPAAVTAGGPLGVGEIAEDFTSLRMMDPVHTTALWNDPAVPGVLLGSPARTTRLYPGDETRPDEWVRLGDERIRIRLLLTREELGTARELTGLLWSPGESGLSRARYEGISIRITPTNRRRLRESARGDERSIMVLDQPEYRVEPSFEELVPVPFERPFSYTGDTNLLVEISIGRGDHTNFLRVRAASAGEGGIRIGRRTELLRPVLALRGFSLNPVATSYFYDTTSDAPEYLPAVVRPKSLPRGAEMLIEFQGAKRLNAEGRIPATEPSVASGWVTDPSLLSGYRYLRIRVTFQGGSLTGEEPILDDVVIPFRR